MEGPPEIVGGCSEDESLDTVGQFGDTFEDKFNRREETNHVPNGDVTPVKEPTEEEKVEIDVKPIKVRDMLAQYKIPESVLSLIFWEDVKMSLMVFLIATTLLISLNTMSFISVFAYFNLLLLVSVWSLKIYTSVQATLNSKPIEHPLQKWLDYDISITQDKVSQFSENAGPVLESGLRYARRIIMFENSVRTLKVVVIMYMLTYLGAIMNFLTLVFLAFIGAFTGPFIYEMKQQEINAFLRMTVAKVYQIANETWAKLQPKVKDFYEKLPPVVKNPLSKFLGCQSAKVE